MKVALKLILSGVVAFALAGCAHAQGTPEQQALAAGAVPLSGAQITESIIGHTISGTMIAGGSFIEYYDPTGTIVGHWNKGGEQGPYDGTWTIDGDQLCATYPKAPEASGCYNIALNGAVVFWRTAEGITLNVNRPAIVKAGKAGLD